MKELTMRSALKVLGLLVLVSALGVLASLLGGNAIYQLGGATSLDIEGRAQVVRPDVPRQTDWEHYGGDAGGTRWSILADINRDTVSDLEVAWTFSSGDIQNRPAAALNRSATEATPILVGSHSRAGTTLGD